MVDAPRETKEQVPLTLELDCPPGVVRRDRLSRRPEVDTPTKEACVAWERSLRPGQYFSEKGANRPMRHRTQAVQGHHPGARAWPLGVDGGAWGPQHLSPIPSERSYAPLVPSPTVSPGKQARAKRAEGFPYAEVTGDAGSDLQGVPWDALATGPEGVAFERDVFTPFEPIPLAEDSLPPPPATALLETPWRPPPPGFDMRTLRQQGSNLRAEAASALKDQEGVRQSSLRLAETLSATVENGYENVSLARARLCRLLTAFQRLRAERMEHGEAIKTVVQWQESTEKLRNKLKSSAEQLQRAEQAKVDAQRALEAAASANRAAEAEVIPLERALEAARHRDVAAVEMEREACLEDLADAFRCRRRPQRGYGALVGRTSPLDDHRGHRAFATNLSGAFDCQSSELSKDPKQLRQAAYIGALDAGTCPNDEIYSPLLFQTLSWGFQLFVEACRRSRGMRALKAARTERAQAQELSLLRETLAAWTLGVALGRAECEARRRRAAESAMLYLARWRLFAALEKRFRTERERRICCHMMNTWREAVVACRRQRELDGRLETLVLRRCFRAWKVLRERSTLTPKETSDLCRVADRHRLRRLFEAWHECCLELAATSSALVRGFRCRQEMATLAAGFRAWASLSRSRRWCRRHRLRRGLEGFAIAAAVAVPSRNRRGAFQRNTSVVWQRVRGGLLALDLAAGMVVVRSTRLRGSKCWDRTAAAATAAVTASMYWRRQMLLIGLRALKSGTASAERLRSRPRLVTHVKASKARTCLLRWKRTAQARRTARTAEHLAEGALGRLRLSGAVRAWRHWASSSALQHRKRHARELRVAFVALRQACFAARSRRSAGSAVLRILRRRYMRVLRQALWRMRGTVSGTRTELAAVAVAIRGGAARRRRKREALEAAWRWWVVGWLRRRNRRIREHELEVERGKQRDLDLAELLRQAKEASAALCKEGSIIEAELQRAKFLVSEQEAAFVVSTNSLREAREAKAAAAAAAKGALGEDSDRGRKKVKVKVKGRIRRGQRGSSSPAARRAAGGRVVKGPLTSASDEDRRLRARRLARQSGAARIISAAETRRREAEEQAITREEAAARARGKVVRQEEMKMEALKEARAVAECYREKLEREQVGIEEAEQRKRRVRGETERLMERAKGLERRAEEATQGVRNASGAESKRAALSLEVATAEARAGEIMAILDERRKEAADLRRALTAKECQRQEQALEDAARTMFRVPGTTGVPVQDSSLAAANATREARGVKVSRMHGDERLPPKPLARRKLLTKDAIPIEMTTPRARLGEEPFPVSSGSEGVLAPRPRPRRAHPRSPRSASTTTVYNDLRRSISVLQEKVSSGRSLAVSPSSSLPPRASSP